MSVKKRTGKTGIRWVAIIDGRRDPLSGKRHQIRRTFRTKTEAEQWERQTRVKIDTGDVVEPSKDPVAVQIAHWLDTANLAPNTLKAYQGVVRRIIVPRIGAVPLGKLTGRHVQDLYNSLRETSYAVQVQAVISGTLRLAVREGLIPRNVSDGLRVANPKRDEVTVPKVWSPVELMTFLDGVRDHWLFPLFWTGAHTGLRLSELTALKWVDITLDLGRLFVGKSKTAAGRRRLALDAATIDILRAHQAEQAQRRDAFGSEWREHDVVFDRGNGEPVAPRTVEATMTRRVRQLGLPHLTPHGLRHCHATMLLIAGTPVHLVQQRLGHSTSRITLDVYAHVLPGTERDVAERFADVLSGAACDQMVTKSPEALSVSAS